MTLKARFTLFESDEADFLVSKDRFKYGDGIYWDSTGEPNYNFAVVPISPIST